MATLRRRTTVAQISPFPSTEDSSFEDMSSDKTSLLYTMLPTLVRKRLRRIPSLRRSVSSYGKAYSVEGTPSNSSSSNSSRRSSGELLDVLRTPPPEYRSTVSFSEPVSDVEELDDDIVPDTTSISAGSGASRNGKSKIAQFLPLADNWSGIRWKFANQGLSLLNLAAQESSTPPPHQGLNNSNLSLARQLYIHGLTYLLRGLPKDLSAEEKISVWSSVPDTIHELSSGQGEARDLVVLNNAGYYPGLGQQAPGAPGAAPEASILHRMLATLIVQLFLIANFLIPYIKVFIGACYRYERQHRISERVFAGGMGGLDWSVKKGMEISERVSGMNEGRVGQAIGEGVVWWIRGVTGGIHQGLGEGLTIMGIDGEPGGKNGKGR